VVFIVRPETNHNARSPTGAAISGKCTRPNSKVSRPLDAATDGFMLGTYTQASQITVRQRA
jgi:hypothetical protein